MRAPWPRSFLVSGGGGPPARSPHSSLRLGVIDQMPGQASPPPPDTNEPRPRSLLLVGSALLVELVEDRGEQRRDDLEGVERSASRAGRGDDERARGVARRHADHLAGQA